MAQDGNPLPPATRHEGYAIRRGRERKSYQTTTSIIMIMMVTLRYRLRSERKPNLQWGISSTDQTKRTETKRGCRIKTVSRVAYELITGRKNQPLSIHTSSHIIVCWFFYFRFQWVRVLGIALYIQHVVPLRVRVPVFNLSTLFCDCVGHYSCKLRICNLWGSDDEEWNGNGNDRRGGGGRRINKVTTSEWSQSVIYQIYW